jgi:diguanylate cyclase (GGDEF)-like protein
MRPSALQTKVNTGSTNAFLDIFSIPSRDAAILVVEDNPDHAMLITRLLRKALGSVQILRATSVSEGLSVIGQTQCQLIIADLGLPDALGIEAVERLHRAAPRTPMIVLSGNADEQIAATTVQSGAEDYLLKDEISERTLRRAIRYAIERQHGKERLEKLALYDTLTNLINRNAFNEHLAKALQRASRQPGQLVLMFIDLDRFKDVNDFFGHAIGDLLLAEVGGRIKGSVRESDVVARLGGDEFGVILENVADEGEAAFVAQRLLESFGAPCRIQAHALDIRASIGITSATGANDTVEQIAQRADAAMYQAKEAGRSQYCFFNRALHQRQRLRRQSEKALRAAAETNAFELHYQPQYCLRTDRIIGAEALLRWRHPQQGLIAPVNFIRMLEEQKLIFDVGKWVLSSACKSVNLWQNQGWNLRLAINVSPMQFADQGFLEEVRRICHTHHVDPSALQFELTENALMADTVRSRAMLAQLKAMGLTVAIDDFGSGYSSLAYLRKFPVHTLKIDRAFVSGSDGVDETIISAIAGLGHSLGFKVMGEGVETQDQANTLARLGCDSAQGFWKCEPVPEAQFSQWLKQHPKSPGR